MCRLNKPKSYAAPKIHKQLVLPNVRVFHLTIFKDKWYVDIFNWSWLEFLFWNTIFAVLFRGLTEIRRDGWVAETTCLLNMRAGNRTGGSNPPLSARCFLRSNIKNHWFIKRPFFGRFFCFKKFPERFFSLFNTICFAKCFTKRFFNNYFVSPN